MNIHKNARLSYARRVEMAHDIKRGRLTISEAAQTYGVTPATVRKWWGRYLAQGEAGLHDRSSRPNTSPRTIAPSKAAAIVELRRRRQELFRRYRELPQGHTWVHWRETLPEALTHLWPPEEESAGDGE